MSHMEIEAVETEIKVNRMNFFERVTGIVISPGRVMADLAEKPRILFPLFLIALQIIVVYSLRLSLFKDSLIQSYSAQSGYLESLSGNAMTPEMLEKSVQQGLVWGLASLPISSLLMWLVITLIFFAVIKIGGGEGRFKHYLSVIGYSHVIYALYLLLVLIISFFTGSLYIDIPLTSFANLLGSDMKGTFLFGIMKGLDVFSIWQYVVMAIGLATVSKFRKKYVCYIFVAVFFIIGLAIAGTGELALGKLM